MENENQGVMSLVGKNRTCLLAIVIVNFRTPALVVDAVDSLLPETSSVDCKIVIVDNCSGDDSLAQLQCWRRTLPECDAQRIELVCTSKNGGFAYGNNVGISRIKASYYLLLNSDTLVRKGAIIRLLGTMQKNPDAGLLGPRLEWKSGVVQESCFRRHGLISELLRGAQLTILRRLFKSYEIAIADNDIPTSIDWVSFACVMVRDKVIRDVGYLDDHFFMYFEDVDYCLRARKAGWKVMYDRQARVVHLRGGTSPVKQCVASRAALPKYYYQSRSRYFRLRGGVAYLALANVFWYLGRLLSLAKLVQGRRDRTAVAGEWGDIWMGATGRCYSYDNSERSEFSGGALK